MQTTQDDRDRRQPRGGRPSGAASPGPSRPGPVADRTVARPTAPARRPVVAALVVLALWCAWLLVPDPVRRDLVGAPAPSGVPSVVPSVASAQPEPVTPDVGRSSRSGPDAAAAARGAQVLPAEGAPPEATTASQEDPVPGPVEQDQPVEVPEQGDGGFVVASGGAGQVGQGRLVRYSVEVEGGLPLDPAEVAGVVDEILADPRSWTGDGQWALQRTDSDPDVRIRVASPATTDALCAPLRTNGELSCRNGPDVVLNALRWTRGTSSWGADVNGYREYLVNHELGHFLGHGHVRCPAPGEPAPVMLQQTIGLQGCVPNGWPFP